MTGWHVVLVLVVAAVVGVGAWLLTGHDEAAARQSAPVGPRPGEPGYMDDCVLHASCDDHDHTYSWPCVWAPTTGWRWLEEQDARPDRGGALWRAQHVRMPDRSNWGQS